MGPTASGKTDIAIKLVQHYPFEIISVDSAMVYRDMDIGTAKPSAEELAIAPHHLINLCDPSESYSVGRFCEDANQVIAEIHARGNIPLLTGGTMLYFHQLQQGFQDMPNTDPEQRSKVAEEAKQLGWPAMHAKLEALDPTTAERLHQNDAQRISRALEVFYSSGKTLTEWRESQNLQPLRYKTLNIILAPNERSILHARIAKRFDLMLERGFQQEVEKLYQRGDLSAELPSIRSVGYRQMWSYLSAEIDHDSMREQAIIATRQLAKRQITWLRRWRDAHWIDPLLDSAFNNINNLIIKNE
ncbi:MAG: tRNA (adenosine(37)-N6)-dimethylallyltransferase MiaA [Gammaproteobacteria bacterium]|nr:tRNA (adenosine(37)-N6)-dimethylallyltransferase MiaA [Gammaproteobacteria bacterium]MCH9743901.1 tRNA (adenosine(37)-N6)-dimethylallyltransferase MiaA [Gammaproteobacteria bacterium]